MLILALSCLFDLHSGGQNVMFFLESDGQTGSDTNSMFHEVSIRYQSQDTVLVEEIRFDYSDEDSTVYNGLELVSLDTMLADLCAIDVDMVFLNEHHYLTESRSIILEILQNLRKMGFEILFMEMLSYSDTHLNDRKYPLLESGYYIQEPLAAELVREAIGLGFKLYPYECKQDQESYGNNKMREFFAEEKRLATEKNSPYNVKRVPYEENDVMLSRSARDYVQYRNLMGFWNGKKAVIIGGHGHGMKKRYGGWVPLGYWLESNKKINFVSIDLVSSLDARSSDQIENRIFSYFGVEEPKCLKYRSGDYYNHVRFQPYESRMVDELFDVSILVPKRSVWKEDWRAMGNTRILKKLDHSRIPAGMEVPMLLKVYDLNEGAEISRAPIDLLLIQDLDRDIYFYGHEEGDTLVFEKVNKRE